VADEGLQRDFSGDVHAEKSVKWGGGFTVRQAEAHWWGHRWS